MSRVRLNNNARICIALDCIQSSGADRVAVTLCRRLLEEGFEVDLVCLTVEGGRMLSLVPAAARVMTLQEASSGLSETWADRIFRLGFAVVLFPAYRALRALDSIGAGDVLIKKNMERREWMSKALSHLRHLFSKAGLRAFWRVRAHNRRLANRANRRGVFSLDRAAYYAANASRFADYADREKPDAVYAVGNAIQIMALLARREMTHRPRFVASMHAGIENSGERMQSKFAWHSHLYQEADLLHVVSRGLAEYAAQKCDISPEHIVCVHNPALHKDIQRLKRQKCSHPWIAEKGRDKIILWVGRAEAPQKDYETLWRSFQILSGMREARLVMLGASAGWVERRLQETGFVDLQERVLGIDYAENPYSWMADADALVVCSKSEGLPTVLIEAMACGCPVVSTDCHYGPREILDNGRWGRLTPVGDPQALALAIDATLKNPLPAEKLIARAMDFAEDRVMPRFMEMLGLSREPGAG